MYGRKKERLFKDGKGMLSLSLSCFVVFAKIHQVLNRVYNIFGRSVRHMSSLVVRIMEP